MLFVGSMLNTKMLNRKKKMKLLKAKTSHTKTDISMRS